MKRISTAGAAKQAITTRRLRLAAAAAIALAAGGGMASASEISVNFEGGASGSIANTQSLGSTGSAGLSTVQELASTWNEVPNGSGASIPLKDDQSQTAATMTFSGGGVWAVSGTAYTDPNLQLLNGYVYSFPGTTAVTASVSGLGSTYTGNGYSVYVYFNSASQTQDVTISVTGSLSTYDALAEANSQPTGGGDLDFVQTTDTSLAYPKANYAVFTGLTSSSFTISLVTTFSGGGSGRAGIAGFQVVSAPEPCGAALVGLGATTLLLRRRRSFVETQVKSPEYANDFDYRCASIDRRASRVLSP